MLEKKGTLNTEYNALAQAHAAAEGGNVALEEPMAQPRKKRKSHELRNLESIVASGEKDAVADNLGHTAPSAYGQVTAKTLVLVLSAETEASIFEANW